MKFIILICFTENTLGVHINCKLEMTEIFDGIGKQITCKAYNISGLDDKRKFSASGLGSISKNKASVTGIHFGESSLSFIPPQMKAYFPNLKVVVFNNTGISSISRDDLEDFKNLLVFEINGSNMKELPIDLFYGNPKLRFLTITNMNELKNIKTNMLLPKKLSSLEYVDFRNNGCVNEFARNKDEVAKLNSELDKICSQNQERLTTSTVKTITETTTISTTTSHPASESSTISYATNTNSMNETSTIQSIVADKVNLELPKNFSQNMEPSTRTSTYSPEMRIKYNVTNINSTNEITTMQPTKSSAITTVKKAIATESTTTARSTPGMKTYSTNIVEANSTNESTVIQPIDTDKVNLNLTKNFSQNQETLTATLKLPVKSITPAASTTTFRSIPNTKTKSNVHYTNSSNEISTLQSIGVEKLNSEEAKNYSQNQELLTSTVRTTETVSTTTFHFTSDMRTHSNEVNENSKSEATTMHQTEVSGAATTSQYHQNNLENNLESIETSTQPVVKNNEVEEAAKFFERDLIARLLAAAEYKSFKTKSKVTSNVNQTKN
jgi:hypothetical protein